MFHTSPEQIIKVHNNGIAGSCLFFSDDEYVMTTSSTYYVYEADFNCVSASQLYDYDIIAEIYEYFDVDYELAEALLDASENEWDLENTEGDDSWWLQGKRGECAVKMGYDGCQDKDEQGTVYIVPMMGRESELKLIRTQEL